jgi:hypothetical protein
MCPRTRSHQRTRASTCFLPLAACELKTGKMWNPNSLVARLLTYSEHDMQIIRPPEQGRPPGWPAGPVGVARDPNPAPEVQPAAPGTGSSLEAHGGFAMTPSPTTDSTRSRSPAHRFTARPTAVGFWAAILTATFSLAWLASVVVQVAVAPVPKWEGVESYVTEYSDWHLLPHYPSLLLALTFLLLLSAIHFHAEPERRVWSLTAIAVGVLYATMASISYNVQVVSVRRNLLAGEADGLDMFPLAYPDSIARALGNSYVYMSLAMVLAGLAMGATGLERWIKALLILSGLAAPLQFTWSIFDTNYLLEASLIPWILGAVVAPVLLAVMFRREPSTHQPEDRLEAVTRHENLPSP